MKKIFAVTLLALLLLSGIVGARNFDTIYVDGLATFAGPTITIADKNVFIGNVVTPSDTTADGGGFTLLGATNKTITWDDANDNWTFNQSVNLESGLSFKINNVTVLSATTLDDVLYVSSYNIVYTQTGSDVTVFTLPANAYVTEVKVMTTEAFDDGSTLTCDIGWSGTLEGYASDLDIKASDGWAFGDVYTNYGVSVGGTARDILVSLAAGTGDGSAGAATVYVKWTMGAPGTL